MRERNFLLDLKKYKEMGLIESSATLKLEEYLINQSRTNVFSSINIFYAIGSLLLCSGIILFFAYNWDEFPLYVRLSLAFVPLIFSILLDFYVVLKNKSQLWKECGGIFNIAGVAIMISFLSQIYQINGNTKDFFLIVIALTIIPTFLFRSNISAIIYVFFFLAILLTSYGDGEDFFHRNYEIFYLPLLLFVFLKTPQNHILKIFSSTLILSFLFVFNVGQIFDATRFVNAFTVGIYLLLSSIFISEDKKIPFTIVGAVGFLIYAATLNIESLSSFGNFELTQMRICSISTMFAVYVGFLIFSILRSNHTTLAIVASLIFPLYLIISFFTYRNPFVSIGLINLLIAVCGYLLVRRGFKENRILFVNIGATLFVYMGILRFIDVNTPILPRSIMLLCAGVILITLNYIFNKNRSGKNV